MKISMDKLLRGADVRRYFLVGQIYDGLDQVRDDARLELRTVLDKAILRETTGLEDARRDTERLFGGPLQNRVVRLV